MTVPPWASVAGLAGAVHGDDGGSARVDLRGGEPGGLGDTRGEAGEPLGDAAAVQAGRQLDVVAHLGFGRIVSSEIEAPNMLANLARSG
jgi:hypothetical protein